MKDSIVFSADGYKYSHAHMIPDGTTTISSYTESRGGRFPHVCWFGQQGIIKESLVGPVLELKDIEEAKPFFRDYFAGREIFDGHAWERMYEKHGGYLPISIRSAPEGLVIPTRNLLSMFESTDEDFPWLPNFLEDTLMHAWYPTPVCTLSMEIKKLMIEGLTSTESSLDGLLFMLNDFGLRGATGPEAAQRAGAAHLVHFMGTDNVPGLRWAMRMYRTGMVGGSIPATEHSVMTILGRMGEALQVDRLLDKNPTGMIACVGDSYDMFGFITDILAARKDRILARNGVFVVRPDSGDPPRMSVEVLNRLGKVFGYTTNSAEFKILPPQVRMIYGDGLNYESIIDILRAVHAAGWAIENMVFGMGGALLQSVNRDTQEFAIKTWEAIINGEVVEISKDPITSKGKRSKKGRHKLIKAMGEHGQYYETVPLSVEGEDQLVETLRDGRLLVEQTFKEVQANAAASLAA